MGPFSCIYLKKLFPVTKLGVLELDPLLAILCLWNLAMVSLIAFSFLSCRY